MCMLDERACTFGTVPDQERSWYGPPVLAGDPLDVLTVGDLNPDLLVSGEDVIPRFGQQERYASMYMTLGGSAGIFATRSSATRCRSIRMTVIRQPSILTSSLTSGIRPSRVSTRPASVS